VNLLKNNIGVAQAEDLVGILKAHPTLKSLCGNMGNETALDMSGKMNGATDAIMLVPEIIDNRALLKLVFGGNMYTDHSVHPSKYITPKPARLEVGMTEVDLSSKGLKAAGAIIVAAWISDKDNGAILSVNLLINNIPMEQTKALVSMLKEHPTLKSLCGNRGDETELDMSGKQMGASDAIMLAAEIVGNRALKSLNLSSNDLQAKGAQIVVEAIKVTN
jgi:hypothetical protein